MSIEMKKQLMHLVQGAQGYLELRWHKRVSNQFLATKGRVDVANQGIIEGVGVRALVNGSWGFAATADISEAAIKRAIEKAQKHALLLSAHRQRSGQTGLERQLASARLSKKDHLGDGFKELQNLQVSDKLSQVVRMEQELAKTSAAMHTARVRYTEYLEEKAIVTSDGAACSFQIAQPELSVSAIAERDGERSTSHRGAGVNGGWNCLFQHPSLAGVIDEVAQNAVDLLRAKYPEGGKKTCILSPAVVGLLCHEAIGHTVEADFVKSGSVAQGKIGQKVASPLVSMADTGCETIAGYAVGNLPFDDEGVETQNTMIIKDGVLSSYLHNRESAKEFGVEPTGNSRAWLYSDEPLIRMRNTYLLPGKQRLQDMISSLDDGYLVEGAGSGQADSNGEFMFGSSYVWRIKNGQKVELLREATLSGLAFDVLHSVDAVSQEFLWDLGTGHCGKGQPAKVDAGGPYIRCQIIVGGRQS